MEMKAQNVAPSTPQEDSLEKSTATVEVVHLPQVHNVDGVEDPAFRNLVAKSQHEIALQLKNNPGAHVFSEGLTEDYTEDHYKQMSKEEFSLVAVAKMYFPKGLPSDFEQLNDLQKEFLVNVGGDETAFMLGDITRIERALPPEESAVIDQKIAKLGEKYGDALGIAIEVDPELKKLVVDERESLLAAEVNSLVESSKYNGAPIYIVYGAGHELADNFAEYNFRKEPMASLVLPRSTIRSFGLHERGGDGEGSD